MRQRAIEEQVAAEIDLLRRVARAHGGQTRAQTAVAVDRAVEIVEAAEFARPVRELLEARRTVLREPPLRRRVVLATAAHSSLAAAAGARLETRDVRDDVVERCVVRQRHRHRAHLRAARVAGSVAPPAVAKRLELAQQIPVADALERGRLQNVRCPALTRRDRTRRYRCTGSCRARRRPRPSVADGARQRHDVGDRRPGRPGRTRASAPSAASAGRADPPAPCRDAGAEVVELTRQVPAFAAGKRRCPEIDVAFRADAVTGLAETKSPPTDRRVSRGVSRVLRARRAQAPCRRALPRPGIAGPTHSTAATRSAPQGSAAAPQAGRTSNSN